MKKTILILISALLILCLAACGNPEKTEPAETKAPAESAAEGASGENTPMPENAENGAPESTEAPDRKAPIEVADGFVLISGGTFFMGSPENENWRIGDETLHEVSVSSFFMDPYETTQKEYERLMGMNPSAFIGSDLPVESMISRKKRSFPSVPMEADGLGRALQRSQSLRRMQVWVKACRSIIPAEEPCRKTFPHGLTETALNESEVQR